MRRPSTTQAKSRSSGSSRLSSVAGHTFEAPVLGRGLVYLDSMVSSPQSTQRRRLALRRGVADGGGDAVPHQSPYYLVSERSYRALTSVPKSKMVQAAADWLGVAQWERSYRALAQSGRLGTRSIGAVGAHAPEYLVNA